MPLNEGVCKLKINNKIIERIGARVSKENWEICKNNSR